MEVIEAIRTRRSVRDFKDDQIPEETVKELLETAVWAPSGMNMQPWVFAIVQNREFMREFSERAKARIMKKTKEFSVLERYSGMMGKPDFNIFYNAPALVLIYGDSTVATFRYDCSMAALNLMLAAWDKGIGSCWIGFAQFIGNTPEIKGKLNIPDEYELVAPVILGYPKSVPPVRSRKEPRIVAWKR
ncbi:MAG: nitroreductase [Firmicutes bacterium]|nr:nitroreductase [Bacillota bacterium]